LKLDFDARLRLGFRDAKVATDAGLLAMRELDEAPGPTGMAGAMIGDGGTGGNIGHELTGLLRKSVYAGLAGYDDVNDHERLFLDPTMRAVVGRKDLQGNSASTQSVSRFETETPANDDKLDALSSINHAWVYRAMRVTRSKKVILDMDSSEFPEHGGQEDSACNGHFRSGCYHPLFCFNRFGDREGAHLRSGNVHSADG